MLWKSSQKVAMDNVCTLMAYGNIIWTVAQDVYYNHSKVGTS